MGTMEIKADTTIGSIVRHNYKTSHLFEKRRIDFCCGGDKTLEQACIEKDIEVDMLKSEIEEIILLEDWDSQYLDGLTPVALCEYIVKRHHHYIHVNAPLIQQRLRKLIDAHSGKHSQLFEIKRLFDEGTEKLIIHMKKEELLFFPFIKSLYRDLRKKSTVEVNISELLDLLNQLEMDHNGEGKRFQTLAILTNQYQTPSDGCHTFEVTYRSLEDFEKDLHRHIHLENNILFPKIDKMINLNKT
jgi:regulator of cell morphogenesis and NO signaling